MENLTPPPMTDAEFRKKITKLLLGDDWFIAFPISQAQANTCIYDAIKLKYKCNIFKKIKLWMLLKLRYRTKN